MEWKGVVIPFRKGAVTSIDDAGVELYEDDHFTGRRLRIDKNFGQDLNDYDRLTVEGRKGFDNKASSARWQLPQGYTYKLYQNRDCDGKPLDLTGTGKIEEISDFKDYDFGDMASSSSLK